MARAIGWAVGVLARRVPWDGRCLAQATRCHGHVAPPRLGRDRQLRSARGNSAGFDAHAWPRLGSVIVTGGPVMSVSRPLRPSRGERP